MTETTSAIPPRRIDAARAAFDAYEAHRGFKDDADSTLVDLMTDLLHLAGTLPATAYKPDRIHFIAWNHYKEETGQ